MTGVADMADTADAARAGAESVFGYLERSAEWGPDGIRWRTLSYRNEPQFDTSLFNGVAGIVLFLADYAAATGSGAALRLAALALIQYLLHRGRNGRRHLPTGLGAPVQRRS